MIDTTGRFRIADAGNSSELWAQRNASDETLTQIVTIADTIVTVNMTADDLDELIPFLQGIRDSIPDV